MARRTRPALLARNAPPTFPNPNGADSEGLVAIGGDLSTERLLAAYEQGIFPWYSEGLPPMWWSPDPRAVMDPEKLRVSRSLAREIRRKRFRVTFDRAFEAYLRQRFTTAANQPSRARGESAASLRVEGEVTAIRWPVVEGLACLELWVPRGDDVGFERWAIECSTGGAQRVTEALKPGDHVVVTGPRAQGMTAHRLTLESLARPADGLGWRADM